MSRTKFYRLFVVAAVATATLGFGGAQAAAEPANNDTSQAWFCYRWGCW